MRKLSGCAGQCGATRAEIADLSHLPVRCRFIAMMPQWDFLDFLAAHGRRYAGFTLLMQAEARELIEEGGRVAGVRATVNGAAQEIRADLVVGADGRHSTVRERTGIKVRDIGAPTDALWRRLSHQPRDPPERMRRFDAGSTPLTLDRRDHWQRASRAA